MSKHREFEMIHLLYKNAEAVISAEELNEAGVPSRQFGADSDVVTRIGDPHDRSKPAGTIQSPFAVAQRPDAWADIRIDCPEVFVVMPFREPWSNNVFKNMFEAGARGAGYKISCGDNIVRIGDFSKPIAPHKAGRGCRDGDLDAKPYCLL